jgi:hypothetical protein
MRKCRVIRDAYAFDPDSEATGKRDPDLVEGDLTAERLSKPLRQPRAIAIEIGVEVPGADDSDRRDGEDDREDDPLAHAEPAAAASFGTS